MRNWFRKIFIPNEHNDYKPHSLQKFAAGVMLLLILCSYSVANVQTLVMLGSDWFISTILPGVLVDLTNENRNADSLGALRRNDTLDAAAQLKAEDMAKYSYFAHHSPAGVSPWYWFDEVGYTYLHAGENLAVHFTESSEVVEAWMDSPGHRANILNGNYTEIGIGTAKGEYKGFPTIYVVQLFGTPSTLAVATAPQPEPEPVTVPEVVPTVTTTPTTSPAVPIDSEADAEAEPEEDIVIAGDTIDAPTTPGSEATTSEKAVLEDDMPAGDRGIPTSTLDTLTAEAEEEDATFVLYSDLSTSSPLALAESGNGSFDGSGTTPFYVEPEVGPVLRVLTESTLWLSFLYLVLGSVVLVSLILSIVIEWRRQHPIQIAYGTGLIALLIVMFNVHEALVGGALIL